MNPEPISRTVADLYLRQSLDKTQDEAAVDRQRAECLALCDRLEFTVGTVYTDNDVSATSGVERPDFDRLLASRPQAIVAWHQDRLLRLTKDLERVIDLNIPVYFVQSSTLDLTTPAGRAVGRTIAAWSQYEGEQKSIRQKAANRQRAAAGKPWTTRRAFGFEEDAITHREEEAAIIRTMYADLLAGTSQAGIRDRLNRDKVPTTMGNAWRQSSVRALLMNPRNAGLRTYTTKGPDKKPVTVMAGKGQWEPIVDEATWRAAVRIMTARAPRQGGGRRKHLLSGLARCGVCGSKMRGAVTSRGEVIYSCFDRYCVSRSTERLDAYVSDVVIERLSRPDALDLLIDSDAPGHEAIQAEADSTRQALDALAEMYAAGELDLSSFQAGTKAGRARLADIQRRLTDSGRASTLGGLVGLADVKAAWADLDLPRRRAAIDALMSIHVDKTVKGGRFRPEHVRIEWKV